MERVTSNVAAVVAAAARRIKLATLSVGVCWWLATALGVWLLLFVLDNLLGLPAGLRLPLALGGAGLAMMGFVRRIWQPATRSMRPERVAVALEARYAVPENLLINTYQFESRKLRPEERVFVQHTVDRCATEVARVRFRDLWEPRRLTGWGAGALLVLGAWLLYVAFFPKLALNAGARFVRPLGDVPPVSAVTLTLTPANDVTVLEGESVAIRVEADKFLKVPPVIVWKENVPAIGTDRGGGETVEMVRDRGANDRYGYSFTEIRRPLAFRVFAADAYTRSIQIRVRPLPRIAEAEVRVTPPAYTGLRPIVLPGPPTTVAALPGARLEIDLKIQPAVAGLWWQSAEQTNAFASVNGKWQIASLVNAGGAFEIAGTAPGVNKNLTLARGVVRLETDNPPDVDFLTEDRNRFVTLGATVKLDVQAKDDYGVKALQITARPAEQDARPTVLKTWNYIGPPGNAGPLKETYNLDIDPRQFEPGATYLIEAFASDFCPRGQFGKSRPIVLRIKSAADFNLSADDPLSEAFEALKRVIVRQEGANTLTGSLKTHLDEAQAKRDLPRHQQGMTDAQDQARKDGQRAVDAFTKQPEGKPYASVLTPLVTGEMPWVISDIAKLTKAKPETLPGLLDEVEKRQGYILDTLLSLLGQIADARKNRPADRAVKAEVNPPPVTAEDLMKDLKDDLQKFVREQEKILDRSKTLMDKRPEDLTSEEQKILGDLAREEAGWSKFFEEKLTDFAKLPQQDFADGSPSKELNAVFQEIQLAAKELYAKKVELAVPQEQSGLENAKELEQNLERWLPNKPDYQKWMMEEPPTPADIALAELPAELEDIIGELLDKEEEMADDVEDVTSSWLDSMDKGVGWDAADGPISDMSAKGVTGNLLPNQMEIGGRAGEGRTGRSSGQMVQDEAVGKGGRETPTRLTPSPFEQGSVKDSDTKSRGGATGGGKLSGFGAEGLRGPTPPPSNQANAPRLAEEQAKIRQQAEALALKLRSYKLPTGELEASVAAMKHLEEATARRDGLGVRRAFTRAVDALHDAKQSARVETGLLRERTKLPAWMRNEITTGLQDGTPRGYDEMIAQYFRALAEGQAK